MTIYDVLRHLVERTSWDGGDDIEEGRRRRTALRLIDRLEESGLLGQLALDIQEDS